MFGIKFPTKRIFRIFPILRIDGMAPFGTYLWNDSRSNCKCYVTSVDNPQTMSPHTLLHLPINYKCYCKTFYFHSILISHFPNVLLVCIY